MAGVCARCRREHDYGHRDPDNHYWYCEACWMEFCGGRRCCTYCRVPSESSHGRVDVSTQYWYCAVCWENRQRGHGGPDAAAAPQQVTGALCAPGAPTGARIEPAMPFAPPGGPAPCFWPHPLSAPCMMPRVPMMPYGLPGPGYHPGPPPAGYPGIGPAWYPMPAALPPPPDDSTALASARHSSCSRSPRRDRKRRRGGGHGGGAEDDGGKGEKRAFKPYHATSVPKATDLESEFQCDSQPTTVMLRNIPNKFTQASLLEEIDAEGFSERYDFFYLPMDVRNKTNVGYAFVNFVDPSDMVRFSKHFEGYQFKKHTSQKIATVSPAHVQGLERNIQQLSRKAVTQFCDSQYRPIVLREGRRVDFEQVARELAKK